MNFSNGSTVSRPVFDRLVNAYGLPFRPGDLDIIWANIGISGDTLGYSDFVRFITMERIDPTKGAAPPPAAAPVRSVHYESDLPPPRMSPPRRRPQSLSDIVSNCRRQIGTDLLELDPEFTGFVATFDFELIIQRIEPVDSAEIQRLVQSYDRHNTGTFNYFTLLSDICNQAADSGPTYGQRPSFSDLPPGRQSFADNDFADYPPPHAGSRRDFADPPVSRPGYRRDFADAAPARQGYRGDFADLPPVVVQRTPLRDLAVSRSDEIIRTLASRMTEVFGSSANCFNKWRGYARTVGPQEFVTGAKRDFNLDVSLAEAQEIIDKFSGTLTLGTFSKMVGAGSQAASAQTRAVTSALLDDNDKTLLHIARQAKGKDWEGVIENANTVEQMVPGLKKLSIYVLGSDLRPCIAKYGKDGVIQKIHDFIAGL
jgi:hypothetical protein